MSDFVVAVTLGIAITILGIINMTGNVRSLHWYHRHRVTPENIKPFGKLVGLGSVIIGIAIAVYGILMLIHEKTQYAPVMIVGSAMLIVSIVIGLGIMFYAMIKYNKGIF